MLSLSRRASEFIDRWDRITLNERAVAQSHFNELCQLLSIPQPNHTDDYRFEKPLTKVGGEAGFADVWRLGCFAFEYKTKNRYSTLRAAYEQLQLYKEDLDNPPVLAASDIAKYEVHVVYTGYKTRIERFAHHDLTNLATREFLALALSDPVQLRPTERAETVTKEAATRVANVAQMLERRGVPADEVAHFFTKLLFAFFAEDIQLLPNHVMSESLRHAIFHPEEFPRVARDLFRTMQTGGYFGPLTKIPHINGGLFNDDTIIPLSVDELQFLAEAAKLDWAQVDPTIFGTLFERSLDPRLRSQLGLHYTSRDDIELIVEPVLMRPLVREWDEVQQQVACVRKTWQATTGAAKQKARSQIEGLLYEFADRLTQLRVLDPACGSGNFLYVALEHLKNLEKQVVVYATGIGVEPPTFGVSPTQLHGIEKNPLAAQLAQVVVWIGYIQWMYKNGLREHITEPILTNLKTIECRDAILAFDEQSKPYEPEWPEADVVIGNPPFLGDKKMRGELGHTYVESLRKLYEGRVPGGADLVTYWFERARAQIEASKVQRVGLLATNSIRQSGNRPVLERIRQSGAIFMAWADRQWILDGAAVRVSIIGFDKGSETERTLDGQRADDIFADLTARINTTTALPLTENANLCFLGMMKGGPFDIDADLAVSMIQAPLNSNGRPNTDVVKPRLIGRDITARTSETWIIDFAALSQQDAAQYEKPFKYIQTHVKPIRESNRRDRMRERWWLYGENRPGLRRALQHLHRYIATPEVAKYRLFMWVDVSVIPDHTLHVIARADDYFFGVLQSYAHECWSLAQGARMGKGNDPRYSSLRTFGTFPFPWAPGTEDQADPLVQTIARAAQRLVELRDAWLNPPGLGESELKKRTLTNLYNARPEWLAEAHAQLDAAVCNAYGWPHDLTDEQILERLLVLNLERAAQGGVVAKVDEVEEE